MNQNRKKKKNKEKDKKSHRDDLASEPLATFFV